MHHQLMLLLHVPRNATIILCVPVARSYPTRRQSQQQCQHDQPTHPHTQGDAPRHLCHCHTTATIRTKARGRVWVQPTLKLIHVINYLVSCDANIMKYITQATRFFLTKCTYLADSIRAYKHTKPRNLTQTPGLPTSASQDTTGPIFR
jgi:hypothetical protein